MKKTLKFDLPVSLLSVADLADACRQWGTSLPNAVIVAENKVIEGASVSDDGSVIRYRKNGKLRSHRLLAAA